MKIDRKELTLFVGKLALAGITFALAVSQIAAQTSGNGTADLLARGFTPPLQVINGTDEDNPGLIEFSFTGGSYITITLRAADNSSGVKSISVSFSNPEGCYYYDDDCLRNDFSISAADRISGDEYNGVYRVVVPRSLPPGTYAANVGVHDAATNSIYLTSGDLAELGFPSRLRVGRNMFDFDGDGRSDIAVFRPSNRTWYIDGSQAGFFGEVFGLSSDSLTPADYDGDGRIDISVYRGGTWYWLKSSDGSFNAYQFGLAGDIPVPADFTGDGRADLTVYREGLWWTHDLINNRSFAVEFGLPSDKPVVSDYNGDGRADQAVYRNGEWHLNLSGQGYSVISFGVTTDRPVPADYDGDGRTDEAVFRDGVWYVLNSTQGLVVFQFGNASDIPVPADYDGDGKADPAIYRDGTWWVLQSTNGISIRQFGVPNDKPVPAAYEP